MPAHRIGIAPMTPAERQARHRAKLAPVQSDHASSVSAAHPTAAKTGGAAVAALIDLAGRIPRLARHSPGQS